MFKADPSWVAVRNEFSLMNSPLRKTLLENNRQSYRLSAWLVSFNHVVFTNDIFWC